MRQLRGVLRALAAALCIAVPAAAAAAAKDPRVATTVEPLPERVTLSRSAGAGGLALDAFAAYRVTINNGNPQALNRVFFDAAALNVGSSEALVIDSTIPADIDCDGIGTSQIACRLGSVPARGGSASFVVVVRSPLSGRRIDLAWVGGGDEGKGRGNGCCNQSGTASTALIDPTTDPSFLTRATSFVKPSGGLLFTGNEAVAKPGDGWTTLVKVPPFTAQALTTAQVVESSRPASCAPYALAGGCFQTDLTIPGRFASLDITIRWDKSLFHLGRLPPSKVKLFYRGSNPAIAYPIQLQSCAADAMTYGSAPSPGRPCMPVPPQRLDWCDTSDPSLVGDLEFRVLALDNGVYEN